MDKRETVCLKNEDMTVANGSAKKKRIRTAAKFLLYVVAGAFIAFGVYKCPIKAIFHIDCPGCGLTRAFWAALRLDFKTAFSYHPLFLPIGIEFCYVVLRPLIRKKVNISDTVELTAGLLTLAALIIVWIIKIIQQ